MANLQCNCKIFKSDNPCSARMTQEDLLCDSCRDFARTPISLAHAANASGHKNFKVKNLSISGFQNSGTWTESSTPDPGKEPM